MSILNVNKINPVGGGSTITIAGIASVTNNLTATNISAGSSVTANSFHGDGSQLSNITSTTINNNADNRIITGSGTANRLEGESNLTFNGTNLLSVHVPSATGEPAINFTNSDTGTGTSNGFGIGISGAESPYIYNRENTDIRIATNNTERLRITSDGKLLIKTTTDVFGGTDFGVKGQISIANDNAYRRAYLSGSNNHLYFWNGSNQGYLSSSGNWVDSSDQSLKKDITDLTYGIDALKNLKPRKYKMKSDNKEQIGFIAQEVESVIPEVVDAGETPDGTEQKGLSYGNLTAVLTKALQEAIAKIEKLEAEVAALKGS